MQADRTTLEDLSIFAPEGVGDIFGLIDRCTTQVGRSVLRQHVLSPPATPTDLQAEQDAVKFFAAHQQFWPTTISNGTVVMIRQFFESADVVAMPPVRVLAGISSVVHSLFHTGQYINVQFWLSQLADFVMGCRQLTALLAEPDLPTRPRMLIVAMATDLEQETMQQIAHQPERASYRQMSLLAWRARRSLKRACCRLIERYAQLDAWHSMATATLANGWVFPELPGEGPLLLQATHLVHPLVDTPIACDVAMGADHHFMLLTGANMSGKTTYLRAVGVAALLAHLGMGVPAASMRISFLRALVTNMQVADSLQRGESYFLAEVLRIKNTAERLRAPGSCLVLLDELFKGTNVHDAHECTTAVAAALLHHTRHLIVLSTHLYEVARHFSTRQQIVFARFETETTPDGGWRFTYHMQPGISDDHLGYRILQQAGVIELLGGDG